MRINTHPILEFKRGAAVTITFDGKPIEARDNETIAVALHAAGIRNIGRSMNLHRDRGLFCAIGNCSSCMMIVDGVPNVRTCLELCRDGMTVETQHDKGVLA
ncbi:MAG: (2Fe-2S)-binding protein [Clostridiales bacterium]|nr:(2Fe-2S)-binding protein [Clostridiales bacterium]